MSKDINDIEKIQRAFTYRILGMQELNYWERLEKLHILSLQRRREKIIIINIWKIKYKLIPNSINLNFKIHQRSQAIKATLPPLPRTTTGLLTKYENSFIVKGPKLWNTLPAELTRISNLRLFKTSLTNYLKKIPDKPPLAGYPFTNNNSLLEIKPRGF